jgi:aspartokinase
LELVVSKADIENCVCRNLILSQLFAWSLFQTSLVCKCYWDTAGHATETFEDWVAGHGELWSAQMLASAVRKVSITSF